jgi:CobQ-like glutamine amidotransferase family enzyme
MSTYGDRGNIIVLKKIAEDNNINVEVLRINESSNAEELERCDILFMGGAQDLQQEIVNKDLLKNKGKALTDLIEKGTPGLYVCGAYQFLGNYYKDAYGTEIKGLGVFDMCTESYKTKPRLIGNIVVEPIPASSKLETKSYFVGFENHGGRTFLKNKMQAFAKVVKGFGNNGEDETEGIIYKNSIGTYLHGPILPSNPQLAIWLLEQALENKYSKKIEINFEDKISMLAKKAMLKRLKISV